MAERTCSIDGCERAYKANGLCNTHNERRRLGLDLATPVRQYERGERLCKAPGCDKPRACSADLCAMHYYRPRKRLNRYGLTDEQFQARLRSQRGRCAICKTDKPRGVGWCIDHDHVTGQVRGVLCDPCNKGLGFLQDDPAVLAAAQRYVNQHRQMVLFGPAVKIS
jgi:Recombination endonuclease VII